MYKYIEANISGLTEGIRGSIDNYQSPRGLCLKIQEVAISDNIYK